MTTTATASRWWVEHGERSGPPWAEFYWNDWRAPHRQQIVLALGLIAPSASLYEIGCNSGPNLRLIRHAFPHLHLGGLEGVKLAAEMAQSNLEIPIDHGWLPDALPDTDWDVVLSCYTMAYLDPEDAQETMWHLNRMTRQAIIIAEPCAGHGLPLGQCRDDGLPEWRHDYEGILGELGWSVAWKWPMIPSVQNMNTLLVLER